MSQPALSLAISRFRHVAKDELFESTGRGVKPTARALQLAGPVRRALDLVSQALEQSIEFDLAQSERVFNLALTDYGELVLLPRLIELLDEMSSPIRVNTVAAVGSDIAKEMQFGNIDLYAWIEPIDDEDFRSKQMGTISEVCLMRQDHPVIKDKMSLKQYASLKHLVLELPGNRGPGLIDREMWTYGLKREHSMRIHTYFNAPRILSSTDMVCSMPIQLARRFAEIHPLKIVALPIQNELPTFMIWHKSMEPDPAHTWLREYLISLNTRA